MFCGHCGQFQVQKAVLRPQEFGVQKTPLAGPTRGRDILAQLFCTEDIKDGVVVLVEAKKLVVGVTMSAKVRMC